MIDHHTLLVVAGFALGSIAHQAVNHYNVPVLMVARAAVETAKRTIVEAFEGDSDEACSSDFEDTPTAEAPEHACTLPLAMLSRPPHSQVLIRTQQTPRPPALKPNLPSTLQLKVLTYAGVPAVYLSHTPSWTTPAYQPGGHSAVLRDIVQPLEGPGSTAGTATARFARQQTARLSTIGFVAAAAVIGISCLWCLGSADSTQQHSNSSHESGLNTTAVLSIVTSIKGKTHGSTSAVNTRSSSQLSIYLPFKIPKPLGIPMAALERLMTVDAPEPESEADPPATYATRSCTGNSSTAATPQLQKLEQQHAGVTLYHQGQRDKQVSMLQTALDSGGQTGNSRSGCGLQGACWADLSDMMEQCESGEVQLAETLAKCFSLRQKSERQLSGGYY